jgi:transposase InsO family protein
LALVDLSVVEQRYRAVLAVERGEPKIVVAAQFGVSRQTLHTWLTRYARDGLAGLMNRTHRPDTCPHQADTEAETRVCELRREHPWWGPRRIAHELTRIAPEGSAPPGKSTVYRILRRHGLIELGKRRKRRTYRRWERETPMALWQIDIVGGLMLADGTECKVVTGVDDHSRFCVIATVVVRATGRAVCLAFAEALRRYGVPEEVLTDNGKQFTDRFGKGGEVLFDRICRDNGITHRLTQPASPTTTGKVERFHKTFRREFLDHAEPFDNIVTAQAAVDTWVSGYNCDRPHQALDMGYPAERFAPSQQDRAAAEEMLPLRLPATLQPADSPQACANPISAPPTPAESVQAGQAVEAVREDADTPVTPLVYQGGPLEFDRVVPASGNLAVRGKQFWLGPARAGATVTFWADHDVIHLSIAGARVKTLRSHLSTTDLVALAATGGRPAGPSPLPPAQPGAALEVDRTVSPGGLVSLGPYRLLAAEILAGRRVSVRIEVATLMFFDPGTRELLRTRPNPLTYDQARILRGARPAGPPPRPSVEPVTVQRRPSATGVILVAGQKLALGRSHAHTVVTVHVAEHTITVKFPDGAQRTFTRTTTKPVRSWKAQHPRTPRTDDQPAAGT